MKKVFLHATYSCNAECIHCAVPRRKEQISLPTFRKIFDHFEIEFLVIGGGEPLLHTGLTEMIDYAHERTKVKIETNGRFLTQEFLERNKDKLFQMNVSLDGTERTHDAIRGISTFQHTTRMITYARSLGIDVAVWSVVMDENKGELSDLIEIVRRMGVDKLSFLYATPVQKCTTDRLVDPEEYARLVEEIKQEASDQFQIRIAPYILPRGASSKGLDCLINDGEIFHVDPNGDVYPCVLLLDNSRYCMNNVHDRNLKVITVESPQRCIGLQEALGEDYRSKYGTPVCPCKTVTKEWNFEQ